MDSIQLVKERQVGLYMAMLTKIRIAGTDNLSFFGGGYLIEGGYSLQQNPEEFAAAIVFLMEHLPDASSYLEIGSASGGACRFLYEQLKFGGIITIDDHGHHRWTEQKAHFDSIALNAMGPIRCMFNYTGDSHSQAAKMWLEEIGARNIDLAFIDGDHSYEGCRVDLELVLPMCRRDRPSYVMFHDTVACEGVKRVWQEAISDQRIEPVAEYVGTGRPLGIGIGRVL